MALLQHAPKHLAPLRAPLSVFGGRDDPIVDPGSLKEWDACTTSGARVHLYPGGHHYVRAQVPQVVAQLTRDLLAAYRGAGGVPG
ncbi:hypothetical protein [Streptomyces sp. TS71-3]|uniref:hypothetical protein n=1 Tax=Streptomyces sp. TS71-3 TaxID=2733862 RepID=UPI001BB2FDBD|nr:hypothetical protein [Streptomyces sp. TS71-3]